MKTLLKNKKIIFFFLILGVALISLHSSLAKELEQDYPELPGTKNLSETSTLTELIAYVYNLAIMIAGLAVFVMLVIGGVKWLTSAGDPGRTKDAKDQLTSAVLGLILLLSSFLILETINPQLTKLIEPGERLGLIGGIEINPPPIENGAVLYRDADYKGSYYLLKSSQPVKDFSEKTKYGDLKYVFQNTNIKVNDEISSLRIGGNHLILCGDAHFINCGYFTHEISDLGLFEIGQSLISKWTWNDAVSSAKMGFSPDQKPAEGAILYDLRDRLINVGYTPPKGSYFYPANSECVNIEDPFKELGLSPDEFPLRNDTVSSLSVSGGVQVTLFEHKNCNRDEPGSSISFGHTYDYYGKGANCTPSWAGPGEKVYCCEENYNCIKDLINYTCEGQEAECGGEPEGQGEWHDDASSLIVKPWPECFNYEEVARGLGFDIARAKCQSYGGAFYDWEKIKDSNCIYDTPNGNPYCCIECTP